MRKYETLVLISPELASDARTVLLDGFKTVIEREGGNVTAEDHWGMRDLAYPVRKQMRGYYVRYEYNGPGKLVAELERHLRIAEGVFKFLSVELEEKAEEAA